jgi:hypothetical protein
MTTTWVLSTSCSSFSRAEGTAVRNALVFKGRAGAASELCRL